MAYTSDFKETTDFQVLCKPFLEQLPDTSNDMPLNIIYSHKAAGKARWQWYNFLNHKAPGLYKISVSSNPRNPAEHVFIISRKYSVGETQGVVRAASPNEIPLTPQVDHIEELYGKIGSPQRDKFEALKKEAFPEREEAITKLFGPDSQE